MTDFLRSFRHGLDAAARIEREKHEIGEVLSELNRQLNEETGGKVEIIRHKFSGDDDQKRGAVGAIFRFLTFETHEGLGLRHKQHKAELPVEELAVWKQQNSGYPCEIIFGSERMSCSDRKSLESALMTLLSDPTIGGKIVRFLAYVPQPKNVANAEQIAAFANKAVADQIGGGTKARTTARTTAAQKSMANITVERAVKKLAGKPVVMNVLAKPAVVKAGAKAVPVTVAAERAVKKLTGKPVVMDVLAKPAVVKAGAKAVPVTVAAEMAVTKRAAVPATAKKAKAAGSVKRTSAASSADLVVKKGGKKVASEVATPAAKAR